MSSGIRAQLRVEEPPTCQVAAASRSGCSVRAVSRSATTTDAAVAEEFAVDPDSDLDGVDAEEVFAADGERVYRFSRERGQGCVCELVEAHGVPVGEIRADGGTLRLGMYVPDLDTLRAIVSDLREAFGEVGLDRLTRSEVGEAGGDLVYVDRTVLTDRQRDVLETAHEMGYFSHPKGANATEVADVLGVNRSTFTEHLAAAQSKLLDSVLES